MADLNAVFDGVSAAVEIDYAKFGPRIKGIGDYPFATQPYVQHSATGIFDPAGIVNAWLFSLLESAGVAPLGTTLSCPNPKTDIKTIAHK